MNGLQPTIRGKEILATCLVIVTFLLSVSLFGKFFVAVWPVLSTLSLVVFITTVGCMLTFQGKFFLTRVFRPAFPKELPRELAAEYPKIDPLIIPLLYRSLLCLFFMISLYHSFVNILGWVPSHIGHFDEDGLFMNEVKYWAFPFSVAGGLWLYACLIELAWHRVLSKGRL